MDDSPQPQGEALQPQRQVLMRPDPCLKVPLESWPAIRHLAESGVRYKEIAERFDISVSTIEKRSVIEKWLTPQRLAKARNGNVSTNDPALAVVDVWKAREAESREQVHNGMSKAIERFLAMSPVPQSFAEAATAIKLRDQAINPSGFNDTKGNVSISILATKGFTPQPVLDV
jgi:hypothetical protein